MRRPPKTSRTCLGRRKKRKNLIHTKPVAITVSRRACKRKVLKARDIAGQAAGHFIGKIAGGKPPFFSVQMDMCRFEEKEIPRFSLPVKLGNGKEEMELEILEEIIQQNYIKSLKMSTPSSKDRGQIKRKVSSSANRDTQDRTKIIR